MDGRLQQPFQNSEIGVTIRLAASVSPRVVIAETEHRVCYSDSCCCMINLAEDKIMDAAQKLLKTSALVFVVALLMAVPGWAQPQLLDFLLCDDWEYGLDLHRREQFRGTRNHLYDRRPAIRGQYRFADGLAGGHAAAPRLRPTCTFSLCNLRGAGPGSSGHGHPASDRASRRGGRDDYGDFQRQRRWRRRRQ